MKQPKKQHLRIIQCISDAKMFENLPPTTPPLRAPTTTPTHYISNKNKTIPNQISESLYEIDKISYKMLPPPIDMI